MYSTATGSFRPDYAGFEEPVYAPGSRVRSVPARPDLRDVPIRVPRSEVKAAPAVPVRAPGSEVTAAPMESLSLLLFFLCLQPLLCLLLLTLRLLFNLILKSLHSLLGLSFKNRRLLRMVQIRSQTELLFCLGALLSRSRWGI